MTRTERHVSTSRPEPFDHTDSQPDNADRSSVHIHNLEVGGINIGRGTSMQIGVTHGRNARPVHNVGDHQSTTASPPAPRTPSPTPSQWEEATFDLDDELRAIVDEESDKLDAANAADATHDDTPYEPLPQPPFFGSAAWGNTDSDLQAAVHARPFVPRMVTRSQEPSSPPPPMHAVLMYSALRRPSVTPQGLGTWDQQLIQALRDHQYPMREYRSLVYTYAGHLLLAAVAEDRLLGGVILTTSNPILADGTQLLTVAAHVVRRGEDFNTVSEFLIEQIIQYALSRHATPPRIYVPTSNYVPPSNSWAITHRWAAAFDKHMPRSGHYVAGWRGPAMPPRTVLATLNMNYPKPVFDALVHDPTTTENFIFYPTHTTHPDVISAIDALPDRLDNLQGVRQYAYCGYGAHDFEADQEKGRLWLMYQHISSRLILAIDAYAANDVQQLSRLLRNKHAYLLTRDLQHGQDCRDRRHDHSHKRRYQPYSKNKSLQYHGKLMPRHDKMVALQ